MSGYSMAPGRRILAISGEDRASFLQGLISNDITRLDSTRALWAALLTPQGKYLFDFFLLDDTPGGRILLDVEAGRADALVHRLSLYRLRAGVEIVMLADWAVRILPEGAPQLPEEAGAAMRWGDTILYRDPRHILAGARLAGPASSLDGVLAALGLDKEIPSGIWEQMRLRLGLPDGTRDLLVDRTILLEAGFDELHGVDWEKGCYVGQELTARTKYRGLIKRRLVPLEMTTKGEDPPEPGATIYKAEKEVGEIRSVNGDWALALLRIDAMDAKLVSGTLRFTARPPEWMNLSKS